MAQISFVRPSWPVLTAEHSRQFGVGSWTQHLSSETTAVALPDPLASGLVTVTVPKA